MKGNPIKGANYLIKGFGLILQPKLRLFVLVPLLINTTIFALLIFFTLGQFNDWINNLLNWFPDWEWLSFIRTFIWTLVFTLLLIVVTYSYSMIANLIASPFYGLLAEKTEELLTGQEINASETFLQAIKDTPRIIAKEIHKLMYYLHRALLVLILSVIISFIFPPISTLLWFLLGAWMMSFHYCDYPMDNHKHSLTTVKSAIAYHRLTSLGFGSAVMFGTMIPFVNFIIIPAAVCGATVYWVDQLSGNEALE